MENKEQLVTMQVSLVKTFNSIQIKIEDILATEKLDIKQISDLERYVGMGEAILNTLKALKEVSRSK